MKEFTPNSTGLAWFMLFLVVVWLIIREASVTLFEDGAAVRILGLFAGVLVIRPLYKAFEQFIFYCYEDNS
jgi:hypothetical protein